MVNSWQNGFISRLGRCLILGHLLRWEWKGHSGFGGAGGQGEHGSGHDQERWKSCSWAAGS